MDCRTCGTNVVGDLNENVEDVIPNVESEAACQEQCRGNSKCQFYTYFLANDTLFPHNCFLLTEFVYPAQPCSTCVTGPVDCEVCSGSLTMNGESSQALVLTDVTKPSEISINGWGCTLTLLVVGGGGHDGGGATGGGGGSGYLEYRSIQVPGGSMMTAEVGDQGQSSSVTISGGDTITAEPGEDGQGVGGDGYSGGGGGGIYRAGDGGSDGRDGGDGSACSGGAGTGEDISLYTFTTWSLGPGAGGQYYFSSSGNFSYYYGGGGGGLMVDGAGPQGSSYQGAGYGGGGNGYYAYDDGLQGVILMEIQ